MNQPLANVMGVIISSWRKTIKQQSKPSGGAALISLGTFIIFGILLGLASKWPLKISKLFVLVFGITCLILIPLVVLVVSPPLQVGELVSELVCRFDRLH
jgi:hypothetical protein